MPPSKPSSTDKLGFFEHLRALVVLNDYKRPWGFLLTVALSVGLPVVIGTWLGSFAAGIGACIGGLVSIYLRQTPLPHRLITMALVSFGFCASFMVSLLAGFSSWSAVLALAIVTFWATFICRYFAVPAPGSFFFIMVACIAGALPFDFSQVAQRGGLMLMGCLGASTLGLLYSLIQRLSGHESEVPAAVPGEPRNVAIMLEATTLAFFISASYLVAMWLGFDKPYWAPISCAAIMQGGTFRVIWQRKIHRVVGTAIGMGLTWVIFSLNPGPWSLALLIIALSFVIELLITRNYGMAVIFITPLTIILAEAASVSLDTNGVILLRMIDVVIGSTVGYFGGWVLHQRDYYDRLESWFLRRWPSA